MYLRMKFGRMRMSMVLLDDVGRQWQESAAVG